MKVSEKGALSIYGMGRFPVSLYREQWGRLLAANDDILAFIEANVDKLSVKLIGSDRNSKHLRAQTAFGNNEQRHGAMPLAM